VTGTELWNLFSTNLILFWELIKSNPIALLSLVVSGLVWWQSRKDAELAKETAVMSVKPHLCLSTDTNDKERRFRVIIENNGVGPVIIEAFKVLLDDKEVITGDDNKNPLKTAISKLDIEIADSYDWLIYTKGHSISVSKSQDIFNFQLKQDSSQEMSNVFEELNRVDLVIEYSDLYGNAQITYDTRNNEMKF
jgi:hypothetical protein